MKKKLIVVIVFYDQPEDTIDCVKAVLRSDYSPLNVLLVDNGSSLESNRKIRAAFPEIPIIRLEQNSGFVGGFNYGIQEALEAGATDVFLLSNDAIIEPTTIRALDEADWDVSVPKILFYDHPELVQTAGARWRTFPPSVIMIGFRSKDGPEFNLPRRLEYAIGCAFLARRRVLEQVGGFDPDFQNYSEDYDFFYRVNQAGFKIGLVPEARLYHKDSLTTGKDPKRRRWFLGRNTVLFYRKGNRFPGWQLWSFMAWLILREALKLNFSHLPDYVKGFRDGYRYLRSKDSR
ncbi:MAG: glycosyltransferase family 2 protein [Anaerolineales bacterium]